MTIIVAPKSALGATQPSVGIFWRVNGATLVELEHCNFERMGAEAGASMRKDIDGGWPSILEAFRREAET